MPELLSASACGLVIGLIVAFVIFRGPPGPPSLQGSPA
jgi:hypothetical protein